MIKEVELGDVCHFENGDRGKNYPSQSAFVDDGIPFINAGNLEDNLIKKEDLNYIDEERYNLLRNGKLQPDDILFCLRGSLGKFAINNEGIKGAIASSLVLLRAKDGLEINYFKHYLKSKRLKMLISKSDNGSSQPNLSATNVKKFKIPLPPLKEQKRIAAILDAADDYRKKTKALITKYDELAQSLFLEMFGDTKMNPKKWTVKILVDVCDKVIDCPHSTPKYVEEKTEYPCIRTTELGSGDINWSKMKYLDYEGYTERTKRLIPEAGDIIYGREGTFGEAAIVPSDCRMSLGQRVMLFRPKLTEVNSCFLHAVVRSKGVYHQALRVNSGSTVGHVNVKDIKKFNLIIPPLNLQNQFAERIQAIEAQKEQAQVSLEKADDLFNALLQKAFKGGL